MVVLEPLGPRTMQMVILLHGEPGAGKDAIAAHLVEKHGFLRLAFADRLKEMCEALDPIVGHHIIDVNFEPLTLLDNTRPLRLAEAVSQHGWDFAKREFPEVRRTQQRLATEVIREFVSPTYWADVVRDQTLEIFPSPVVITDMRFQSEYETMHALGRADVQTWWINRPNNPHRIEGDNAVHVSEQWHPPRYIAVYNDGTLDALHVFVDEWLSRMEVQSGASKDEPQAL